MFISGDQLPRKTGRNRKALRVGNTCIYNGNSFKAVTLIAVNRGIKQHKLPICKYLTQLCYEYN